MGKYVVKSGVQGPGGSSPRYDVDAESDLHAAALAIRHFSRLGTPIPRNGILDVETDHQGPQTLSVESVLRWLRREGEGRTFAKAEGLDFLTAEETPR